MTVRERVLALRLLEKQRRKPELAKQLGINVKVSTKKRRKTNIKGDLNYENKRRFYQGNGEQ